MIEKIKSALSQYKLILLSYWNIGAEQGKELKKQHKNILEKGKNDKP